jgi:hypothetical protein
MQINDDLIAVRDLRAGTAEPTDMQVARVRHRVLSTLDGPAPASSGSRRWMFAAASAAAATVLAIGVAVVAQPGPGTGSAQQTGAAQPTVPARAGQVLAVDLTKTPVAIPDGAYLYVARSHAGYRHEMWVEPQGAIVVGIVTTQDGQSAAPVAPGVPHAEIERQRTEFAAEGPSMAHPTPAFLTGLPTDHAALLDLISDQLGRPGGYGAVRNDLIFKGALDFLAVAEPLLSPEVRAAYLEALARIPGAAVDESPQTFAGHDVYNIGHVSELGLIGIFVDSTTGRVVGYFAGVDSAAAEAAEEITYGVVTEPGTRP